MQKQQQPETEQPSNSSDSGGEPPDNLGTNGAGCVSDTFGNSVAGRASADCSPRSGDMKPNFGEREDGEEGANGGGCDDGAETRGSRGAQAADRADWPEDGQRSAGEPEHGGQTGGETEDRAEGVGSHGVEERGKTEPLVPGALIPTQTAAADTAAERGDAQQVVDLGDAGGTEGGGGGGGLPAAPAPSDQYAEDSRTIGGDTGSTREAEQAQPTGSPDGATEQREETDDGASSESAVERQLSPEVGEANSGLERQPAEAPAAPRHDSQNSPITSESRAARSDRCPTEFSASSEEDRGKAGSGICLFLLTL